MLNLSSLFIYIILNKKMYSYIFLIRLYKLFLMAKISKRLRNVSIPKFIKFKKPHKKILKRINIKYKNTKLIYGLLGLISFNKAIISPQQTEAARRTFNKIIKNKKKIWITLKPQIAGTSKPENMRMGKGKGAISH
jgi:ribosomal protein L16